MANQIANQEHSCFQEIVSLLRNEDFPYYAGWKLVEKRDWEMCYCAMGFLARKKEYQIGGFVCILSVMY